MFCFVSRLKSYSTSKKYIYIIQLHTKNIYEKNMKWFIEWAWAVVLYNCVQMNVTCSLSCLHSTCGVLSAVYLLHLQIEQTVVINKKCNRKQKIAKIMYCGRPWNIETVSPNGYIQLAIRICKYCLTNVALTNIVTFSHLPVALCRKYLIQPKWAYHSAKASWRSKLSTDVITYVQLENYQKLG